MKIGLIQKTVALLQISINRGDFRPPACVADVIVERGGVGGGGEGKRKLRRKKGGTGERKEGTPLPSPSFFSLPSPLPITPASRTIVQSLVFFVQLSLIGPVNHYV